MDETGLKGRYDISLECSSAETDEQTPPVVKPSSIFTALQDQLGLKLQGAKGPVEMLIVEKAERPTEN